MLILCRVAGGWSSSQQTLCEWRGTAWTTCQFITGLVYKDNPPFTLKFTPTGNLEEPVNLSCMCLNCGRAENKSMNKQSILHLAYGIFSFLKIK